MLEKQVVKKIMDALGDYYPKSVLFKIHGGPFQAAGIPDIIGCINGRFIAVEVKLPGKEKTLTLIQQVTIKKLAKSGAITFMSTSAPHTLGLIIQALAGTEIDPFELFNK